MKTLTLERPHNLTATKRELRLVRSSSLLLTKARVLNRYGESCLPTTKSTRSKGADDAIQSTNPPLSQRGVRKVTDLPSCSMLLNFSGNLAGFNVAGPYKRNSRRRSCCPFPCNRRFADTGTKAGSLPPRRSQYGTQEYGWVAYCARPTVL